MRTIKKIPVCTIEGTSFSVTSVSELHVTNSGEKTEKKYFVAYFASRKILYIYFRNLLFPFCEQCNLGSAAGEWLF